MSKKIFVSHSSKDDAITDIIAEALEAEDFESIWVDHRRGIKRGNPNWEKTIRQAIGNCDLILFMMSQNSLDSKWCL